MREPDPERCRTPAATGLDFPTLLEWMAAANVLAEPMETVVTERVGDVDLGILNSRMTVMICMLRPALSVIAELNACARGESRPRRPRNRRAKQAEP